MNKARQETIRYHEDYYGSNKLFEEGSWLEKPDYELDKVIKHLENTDSAKILDLGCGVGRNAIYVARKLKNKKAKIDCFDLLDSAIEQLKEYSNNFDVAENINAKAEDMDSLELKQDYYDGILSISVLEHSQSYDTMINTIYGITNATKNNGINRLTFSTDRKVTVIETGLPIESLVETPLKRDNIVKLLRDIYKDWTIEILESIDYDEDLEHTGKQVNWQSKDLSFLAIKS